MTLIVALSASTSLLTHLVNPAARALAVGLVVALALAAFRRTTTSLRLFTWTAVLYSALAMPLLEWMLPPLPMPVPTFLQTAFIPHPEGAPSKLRLGGVFDRSQQKEVVVPNSARNAEEIKPKPIQSSHISSRPHRNIFYSPVPRLLHHFPSRSVGPRSAQRSISPSPSFFCCASASG